VKLLLLALLLSTTAHAGLVKAPSCGVGMKCVSEQFTCPIKKAVKKKPVYKGKQHARQTVIPPVVEQHCVTEVIQRFYYDEIIAADYLGKLPHNPINNPIRHVEGYNGLGYTPAGYFVGGFVRDREVIRTVVEYLPAPVIITPPIATPLPSSIWFLVSGLLLFWRRAWLNLN